MEQHNKEHRTENGNQALQPSQGIAEVGSTLVLPQGPTVSGNEKTNSNQEYSDLVSG